MKRGVLLLLGAAAVTLAGPTCARKKSTGPIVPSAGGSGQPSAPGASHPRPAARRRPPRLPLPALGPDEVYVYDARGTAAVKMTAAEARAAGLLVVDLGDGWAPFIFQDRGTAAGEVPKANPYRQTFVALANDRINVDGNEVAAGEHNFLEPFGIPPSLSVLRTRADRDGAPERQACDALITDADREGLRAFTGNVGYLDRNRARQEHLQVLRDAEWLQREITRREAALQGDGAAALAALRADPDAKLRARVERTVRGQDRLRAVRTAQALLVCEGLLSPRSRYTPGMFDLPTHEALAEWERKNDIFGWAFLGGETATALVRSASELDFDAFRRVLAERVADAAGIVEDGSIGKGKEPGSFVDGLHPERRPVPNLIEEHVTALLAALHVVDPDDMVDLLRQHGDAGLATLRVAFRPPTLPPYYAPQMDLSVEIDRGDVWYDFPFDARGRPVEQARDHFPHLTLSVTWRGQKIPLVRWRTTIGSWRSELHANGKIYYRYKNSDVGPRVWKHIVAAPAWVPPDATPVKDLLTRKVFDRNKGPEIVVNTDVMGPGFQSAYGLVMAIHVDARSGFDNQIRTHGSVDYTSIARRFSHGCHRLVNNRAVRLFDFILQRQPYRRLGSVPLHVKRRFVVDQKSYAYELGTRGYYYELQHPITVTVGEGRVMGQVKRPIVAYMRKAGVDYSNIAPGDDATSPVAFPATTAARGVDDSLPITASATSQTAGESMPDTPADATGP